MPQGVAPAKGSAVGLPPEWAVVMVASQGDELQRALSLYSNFNALVRGISCEIP